MNIEITPADVLRLKALGVKAEPREEFLLSRDDQIIIALNDSLRLAVESERRAWREARRWRAWGWAGLVCAAASIAASVLAAVARRGGW